MGLGSSRQQRVMSERRRSQTRARPQTDIVSDSDSRVTDVTAAAARAPSDAATTSRRENANDSSESDIIDLVSYLIYSNQVRLLSDDEHLSENSEIYDDEDVYVTQAVPVPTDIIPDAQLMDKSELKQEILLRTGQCYPYVKKAKPVVSHLIQQREIGMHGRQCFRAADCCVIQSCFLPNRMKTVAYHRQKAFCGIYSADGNLFLSACQDHYMRVYDTSKGQFTKVKMVRARDVGWSVVDTCFSPDGNYLIYSSWSNYIHLLNIYGEQQIHEALALHPDSDNSFCIFSLAFSMDNRDIMGGANDGALYVYDREKNIRSLKIDAHEDDVNAVAFADATSQILFSGGDDGLCKVWDRRALSETNPQPVGVLAGHMDGITFIDTKGDGRYLLSNSKDQTIKLWDMRCFSSKEAQHATRREVSRQNWDYRWQRVPKKVCKQRDKLDGDTSLMTYRGHNVLHTLVRSRFSPQHTTGQRYIYTGCATGAIVIYDILTGRVVSRLDGHRACVRDVSWHPYDHRLVSTSWDGAVGMWYYSAE
ncbi:DDB1- and CUL4-associated factor 11 [Lamellibrachia satsuma]|nr:DDB1- and CUL4-associated factor 11 [Lamellibrachia satsuma]